MATNREKFIEEIENSLHCEGGICLSKEARIYFEELKGGKASVGGITEVGSKILIWLQNNESSAQANFSAKVIGEGLFTSSRSVSGAARKLIADGYLTKEGNNPVTYSLTAEGRAFNVPESENIDKE